MYEAQEGYIFTTFQDGNVIFFKDSYERHCGYHEDIRGQKGREQIQHALIQPNYITKYPRKDAVSGKTISWCKKYYYIVDKIVTSRGNEFVYWEIIIEKRPGKKKKLVTAYITSAPEYAMINNRIEEIEYKKYYEKK